MASLREPASGSWALAAVECSRQSVREADSRHESHFCHTAWTTDGYKKGGHRRFQQNDGGWSWGPQHHLEPGLEPGLEPRLEPRLESGLESGHQQEDPNTSNRITWRTGNEEATSTNINY